MKILHEQWYRDGKHNESGGEVKHGRTYLHHCVAWAFFILYEISAVWVINHQLSSFADYAIHYLFNILLFYFNALVVFPFAYKTERFKYYLLGPLIIGELLLYILISYLLNWALTESHFSVSWNIKVPQILWIASLWRAIYILGLSTGYWFAVHFFKSMQKIIGLIQVQMENQKNQLLLEKEVVKSENAYLQAQVSPHLLFNTLNFIYNSVEDISESAAEAVMLLAEICRYSMSTPDSNGLVLLSDEVKHIKNMIALNQLRFKSQLNIRVNANGDFYGLKIIPLILISFVENIFKHAVLTNAEYPATININVADDNLIFQIQNQKSKHPRISHGIGVSNTKMRLETKYQGNYFLDIIDNDFEYILELRLKLDYAELLYS